MKKPQLVAGSASGAFYARSTRAMNRITALPQMVRLPQNLARCLKAA